MKIWLYASVGVAVLVALSCRSADEDEMGVPSSDLPASAQSREGASPPRIPALIGAPPVEELDGQPRGEFEIVATTFNPSDGTPAGLPAFAVTDDASISLLLRVDEVVRGDSPFDPGQQVVLLVHSPAMMFGGYGFSGRQFAYKFAVMQREDGTTSYSLIGLDTWPRSRTQAEG